MNLIILNGPTGAGKNTVAEIVAQKRSRCAVVDYDVLRDMFRKPHLPPWSGEAGRVQNILGLEHACKLARSFVEHDYDCLILDVLNDETAQLYKEKLKDLKPKLVLLLPTFEEIMRRNKTRPPRLTDDELKMVYDQQTKLSIFDQQMDTSHMTAEEVASKLMGLME